MIPMILVLFYYFNICIIFCLQTAVNFGTNKQPLWYFLLFQLLKNFVYVCLLICKAIKNITKFQSKFGAVKIKRKPKPIPFVTSPHQKNLHLVLLLIFGTANITMKTATQPSDAALFPIAFL